ncbi:MAG: hypothetical protein F6K40_26520 [Okeania sp. SIO3I5]|uniref:hypothetical protein n=1 Tax=Okeania sp. SIO3I5 TaxID=2607805 RepID=UPI0013B5CF45|nr:hypothetical protein [Okeania sp. SIO3I5]NEQ39616.1 hypothetical protein [Okeania sp. SIO3I5]
MNKIVIAECLPKKSGLMPILERIKSGRAMDGLPNYIQSPLENLKIPFNQSFYYRRGNK